MNYNKYLVHPELSRELQALDDESFDALVNSIKTTGQQISIKLCRIDNEVYVLDGHNRLRACQELNIEAIIDTNIRDFDNVSQAKSAIIQINENRRQRVYTKSDAQDLIKKYYNEGLLMSHGRPEKGDIGTFKSAEEIAAELGMSERSVKRVIKRVKDTDELVEAGLSEKYLDCLKDTEFAETATAVKNINNASDEQSLDAAVAAAPNTLTSSEIKRLAERSAFYQRNREELAQFRIESKLARAAITHQRIVKGVMRSIDKALFGQPEAVINDALNQIIEKYIK